MADTTPPADGDAEPQNQEPRDQEPVPRLPRGRLLSRMQLIDVFRIGMFAVMLFAIIALREPCGRAVSGFIGSFDAPADAGPAIGDSPTMELIRLTPEEIERRFPNKETGTETKTGTE